MIKDLVKYSLVSVVVGVNISPIMASETSRPNILFAIADDMTYPYMSAYGAKCISTPAFDEVASRGVLFENGYVTSPGSSPSRASILTGNYTWQLEAAGTHGVYFPTHLVTYTDLLDDAGYLVGFTGKGWGPGDWKRYRDRNPAGDEYNDVTSKPPYPSINSYNYFENFKLFLEDRDDDQPFCFWFGCKEAHRTYGKDNWKRAGKSIDVAEVPEFLPDTPEVRGDIMDYVVETEWFDTQLGYMLRHLESIGELENTLIVVIADNGMPFPSAKASCHDAGLHVPFAICMGDQFKRQKSEKGVVSTIDLAATFLDLAGVAGAEKMESESLLPWLRGDKKAELPQSVFGAREGHTFARYKGWVYPSRTIRKGDMVYVHNFTPDRWPAGDPLAIERSKGATELTPSFADIDNSPSKSFLINNASDPKIKPYYDLATAKRPESELFDISKDPGCRVNLANDPKYKKVCNEMRNELFKKLEETHDTRLTTPEIWDTYKSSSKVREYPYEQ